VESDEDCGQ
jgi:hypothetical protein